MSCFSCLSVHSGGKRRRGLIGRRGAVVRIPAFDGVAPAALADRGLHGQLVPEGVRCEQIDSQWKQCQMDTMLYEIQMLRPHTHSIGTVVFLLPYPLEFWDQSANFYQ